MTQSFAVFANEQETTLLFTAGPSGAHLSVYQHNINDVQFYLGGPDLSLGNGLLINVGTTNGFLPIILGPNEALYGTVLRSGPPGRAQFNFLVTGVPAVQSSGPQHVIVDGGAVTANQGSPNIPANSWPVTANKP